MPSLADLQWIDFLFLGLIILAVVGLLGLLGVFEPRSKKHYIRRGDDYE